MVFDVDHDEQDAEIVIVSEGLDPVVDVLWMKTCNRVGVVGFQSRHSGGGRTVTGTYGDT